MAPQKKMGHSPATTQAQPAMADATMPDIQAYTLEEGTSTPFEMASPKKGNVLWLPEPNLDEASQPRSLIQALPESGQSSSHRATGRGKALNLA